MKYSLLLLMSFLILTSQTAYSNNDLKQGFKSGEPDIASISTMEFGPEGILFIGDSYAGKVFAIDTKDTAENKSEEGIIVKNIQGRVAAALGTTADNIIIHDIAVNPISQVPYLAVSKAQRAQLEFWKLANDVAKANILLKVKPDGGLEEFQLKEVEYAEADLPVIDEDKGETFRKSSLRVDAITDLVYHKGNIYVAGLSNEEFASTLRVLPFPFVDEVQTVSLEVYHAAHGAYETQAPVRTLVPYSFNGEPHLITAYTCTPLATFSMDQIKDGKHIKSKTVAEFGAGNIPMDMIVYRKDGKDYLMIANSTRNVMRVSLEDVASLEEGLNSEVKGFDTAGVAFTSLPTNGVQQISYLNSKWVLALVLNPGGTLDLRSLNTKWF